MKTRCILPAALIAAFALFLNPLFAAERSASLDSAFLDVEMQEDVQRLVAPNATAAPSTRDNSSVPSTPATAPLVIRSGSNSSTDTPPKPHTVLIIDPTLTTDDDSALQAFVNGSASNTTAFLNQLNRSLKNEWNIKTWVTYLVLGAAYGFYGWRDADYAQMTETLAPPILAFYCPMDQATYDRMYDFIYYVQSNIAFSGKIAYGAIGECLEWVDKLAKRYELNLGNCPKAITTNADVTAAETNAYGKSRLLANTLGLALAGGSALVDAALYRRYLSIAENVKPYELTFLPLWLGMGLTLDNFNDVLDLTYAGFSKLSKTQTGVIPDQRAHLKALFARAQYHLQICDDAVIATSYAQFTQAGNGTANISLEQLQLLTALGRDTDLPNRYARQVVTKSMAALFTLANMYNWWVLGNGIMDLNVAKSDNPTAISATCGLLNTLIFAPLTYTGMQQMGNGIIDTFAPQSAQLPHANHRSESNALKRAFQMLHLPVAFTVCAAGAVAATSLSLYFTLYPDAPYNPSNSTVVYNLTNASYGFGNGTDSGSGSGSGLINATEYDSCDGYYGNDISFFYNQTWYIVQAGTFLVAANSRPVAKALEIMRAAPTKLTDSAYSIYNKARGLFGYEQVEPEITVPDMRDTMMEVVQNASAMLKNANDATVTSLYGDLKAGELTKQAAKQGWVSWAKQLVGYEKPVTTTVPLVTVSSADIDSL